MGKWISGIISAVIISVLTYWATDGFKFLFQQTPYSVTGTWTYKMTSAVDHRSHSGSMELTMDGQIVHGRFKPFDGTDSAVTGTFATDYLRLTRETGMQGTVQFFELRKLSASKLSGSFRNEGPIKDSGTITLDRRLSP
jgi:hypothetical protein